MVFTKFAKKVSFFSTKFQSLPDFGCIGDEDSIVSDDLFSVFSISLKLKKISLFTVTSITISTQAMPQDFSFTT